MCIKKCNKPFINFITSVNWSAWPHVTESKLPNLFLIKLCMVDLTKFCYVILILV